MRVDRVKLIAEMARQNIHIKELAEKALVSRVTIFLFIFVNGWLYIVYLGQNDPVCKNVK